MEDEIIKIDQILSKTSITTHEEFSKVFYDIDHSEKLNLINNNTLKFLMLDIQNTKYKYNQLFDLLKDNMGKYGLSRKEYAKDPLRAISKAIDKFRDASNKADSGAGGELGELILFLLLEINLGAPKILSKLELKTTQNQYVYNADGVHLFRYKNNFGEHCQLILCESKIIGSYSEAIEEAFNSIEKTNKKKYYDISLVTTEIFKETTSEEEAEKIISYIIPNQTIDYKTNAIKETAFGVFIGFSLNLTNKEKLHDSIKIRQIFKTKLEKRIKLITALLNKKINEKNLTGYSFYIYLLPFNNATEDKQSIMDQLLTRNHFEEVNDG